MQAYVAWFIAGSVLLLAELMTGTFYLLVIAVAFACAGLVHLLGASLVVQLLIAALIGFGGSIALRKSRFGKSSVAVDPLQQMDVGQHLQISEWNENRSARAQYRGTQWDVELAAGEPAAPGEFEIREVRANRLIVARVLRS